MKNNLLLERAKAAVSNQLPVPCGKNCPVVCCEPVITGFFMPRNLLFKNDNYTSALEFIHNNINETLNMKTTDDKKIFKFEGVMLTDIDTDNGFVNDSLIEKIVVEKVGKAISPEKMQEYVGKIKDKFRETNTGLINLFSCPHFDNETKGCTIHLSRPQLCRNYSCEQLSPEKVNYSVEIMVQRIYLKKEQRDTVIAGSKKDPLEAIKQYLSL